MIPHRFFARFFLVGLVLSLSSAAWGVPYASGIRQLPSSTNWQFVLNESAENVSILRDGGNMLDLGPLAAGRHTFDMSTFTSWEIKVSKNAAANTWTKIKDPRDTNDPNRFYAHFEQPTSIVVNQNPSSEFFGAIYVNNSRTTGTVTGRSMGDGVYALTADLVGVDFAPGPTTYFAIPDYNDTTFAKAPAPWSLSSSNTSAWRMTLDTAGNVIVGDFSDDDGGIKYASRDLQSGGLVLAEQNGPTGGVVGANALPVHGSITSTPYVTGAVGNGLTVWAMDEDLHQTRTPAPGDGANGNHIWRWNVGNATDYNIEPSLAINTATIPKTSDGRVNHVSINTGINAEAVYSPQHNKWYISENRTDGNDAGIVIVSARPGDHDSNGKIDTADYVVWRDTNINGQQGYDDWRANYGEAATKVEWSSLQFSIDNNIDGHTGLNTPTSGGPNCNGTASCGIQDMFRGLGGQTAISADGTKLFIRQSDMRTSTRNTNPYFGLATGANPDLQGAVIVIPLDANGVPDIQLNPTPTGPGDRILNVKTLDLGIGASLSGVRGVAVDAAGNVYASDGNSEELTAWSPGGATLAITRSNGTFNVSPLPGAGQIAYFSAIPEPSTLALVTLALTAFAARRERRRR